MVHNGVIWNDDLVSKEQFNNGIHYVSKQRDGRFNDSEVLMYDIADVIEGKKDKLECEGSIAFIIVQLDKDGNRKALYFGRNSGNPLKIKKYNSGFSLTSEGDGINIDMNTLFKYDYATKVFSQTPLCIPTGWEHHTYYGSQDRYTGYGSWDDDGYDLKYNGFHNKETGLGYDRWGNKIDKKGNLLPDQTSTTNVFTEQVLERYKNMSKFGVDSQGDEKEAIREIKGALLYDMNYIDEVAAEFGKYMIDELQVRYDELEELITNDIDDSNGKILDEYLELDVQLELLSKAVDELDDNQLLLAIKNNV